MGKLQVMQTEMIEKNDLVTRVGEKRRREENSNPNHQLSVSKRPKFASNCKVVNVPMESVEAIL